MLLFWRKLLTYIVNLIIARPVQYHLFEQTVNKKKEKHLRQRLEEACGRAACGVCPSSGRQIQQHTSQSGVQSNKSGYVDVHLCIYRRVCNHWQSHTMVVLIFPLRRNKVTNRSHTPFMTETKLSKHAYNTILTRQRATLL